MSVSSAGIAAPSHERPWFSTVAHVGFGAKGALYLVVAIIALRGDIATPGATTKALFLPLALGLIAAAAYKTLEAVAHPDVLAGRDTVMTRIYRFASAIAYGGLAVAVLGRVVRAGAEDRVHWTAHLLNQPLGPELVTLAGVVLLAFGWQQLYRARSGECVRGLARAPMSRGVRRVIRLFADVAYGGRGIAYGIVGVILIDAAISFDARSSYRGIAGVFEGLSHTTLGGLAQTVLAGGLAAYGLFCLFVLARYYTPRTR